MLRLKSENRLWGVPRIQGELSKLGFKISKTTVRNILKQNGLYPEGSQQNYLTWREFLHQHKKVWAIDFFTVETVLLETVYVFAAIDIHTRQLVELRCCTTPLKTWTMNALLQRFGFNDAPDLILRDCDTNYGRLDCIGGVKVITSPPGCPWFNSYVERFIGSAQRECTDHFLYFSSSQIQKTLNEYKEYYSRHRSLSLLLLKPDSKNTQRVQGILQQAPSTSGTGPILSFSNWFQPTGRARITRRDSVN